MDISSDRQISFIMETDDLYQYMTPIDRSNLEQTPPQSLVFYRKLDGQNFLCKDYTQLTRLLANSLFESNINHNLLCDWTYCSYHTLIFDIDIKTDTLEKYRNTTSLLMRYFDLVFLNVFEKHLASCLPIVTLLLSVRRDGSGGLHIHCPGIQISHDDYVHLCGLMRDACHSQEDDVEIELDCPSNMCLVACDKPYKSSKTNDPPPGLYVPVRLFRVRFQPCFDERDKVWRSRKVDRLTLYDTCGTFLELHSLNESVFEKIEHYLTRDRWIELVRFMMPIACPQEKNSILLTFSTESLSFHDQNCVAEFTSFANTHHYLYKTRLERKDGHLNEDSASYCYRLLKYHSESMEDFQSFNNRVLKTWYKRFCNRKRNEKQIGQLQSIDRYLRKKCIHLRNEESPLLTILMDMNAYYFLPVFFALCNEMKKKQLGTNDVVYILNKILFEVDDPDTSYPIMKEYLSRFEHGEPLPEASSHLTLDTILYCAFNAVPRKTKEGSFMKYIGLGWESLFELIDTVSEMEKCLLFVQKLYFPIIKGLDPVSKKQNLYVWDPILMTQWNGMEDGDETEFVKSVIFSVFYTMKNFNGYNKLSKSLCNTLNKDFNWIDTIVHDILVDLHKTKAIMGNKLPNELLCDERYDFMEKIYGSNVPQYYFF